MAHTVHVDVRIDQDDDDGTQTVTVVIGGSHRGGVSKAHWSFCGGMTPEIGRDVRDEVMNCVGALLAGTDRGFQGFFMTETV